MAKRAAAKASAEVAVDVADVRARLRAAGLRSTQPRLAVYQRLAESSAPLSHGEVAELLSGLGFDRATVYRNLIDLCDAGLVLRTDHGDHLWRFELVRPGEHPHDAAQHAHFLCTDCGQLECLPDDSVSFSAAAAMPRALGARQVEIQIKGVCDSCAE